MHTIEENHMTKEPRLRSSPNFTQKADGEVAEWLHECVAVEDTKHILTWMVTNSANLTHNASPTRKTFSTMIWCLATVRVGRASFTPPPTTHSSSRTDLDS